MDDKKKAIGCVLILLQLLITMPIWYVLVGSILSAINAETWQWVVFWVYVPLGFFMSLLTHLTRELFKD